MFKIKICKIKFASTISYFLYLSTISSLPSILLLIIYFIHFLLIIHVLLIIYFLLSFHHLFNLKGYFSFSTKRSWTFRSYRNICNIIMKPFLILSRWNFLYKDIFKFPSIIEIFEDHHENIFIKVEFIKVECERIFFLLYINIFNLLFIIEIFGG